MLNEDLLDEKDKKILKLTLTIDKFKEYDKKRTEYVSSLERKIQDLEYQVEDLEAEKSELIDNLDKSLYNKLKSDIKNKNKQIAKLSNKLYLVKHPEIVDKLNNSEMTAIIINDNLKNELNSLRKTRTKMLKQTKELINKLVANALITESQFDKFIEIYKTLAESV